MSKQQISVIDRLFLMQILSSIPQEQLLQVIFTLKPPSGIIPLNTSQGQQVFALLQWAESPAGCGLEQVQAVLDTIIKPSNHSIFGIPDKEIDVPESPRDFCQEVNLDCVYLIINLLEKLSQENGKEASQYYVKTILSIPESTQEYGYIKLSQTFENNKSYKKQEIETKFRDLIEEANKRLAKEKDKVKNLTDSVEISIEFLVSSNLLSSDLECWQEEGTKLFKCHPSVYIRLLERLGTRYKDCRKLWIEKWEKLQISTNFNQDNYLLFESKKNLEQEKEIFENKILSKKPMIIGMNLLEEKVQLYYLIIIMSGVPVALWSRCNTNQRKHRNELDELIFNNQQYDVTPRDLPELVKNRRGRGVISKAKNDLGKHICFLWDNPYNYPPNELFNAII